MTIQLPIARFMLLMAMSAIIATAASAAEVPRLPDGAVELDGTLDGHPFWARLLPPDAQYGGNRVLQLVYQPPAADALAGAHLCDCPFVLLDAQARVVAWNGRETLSQVVPAAPTGYQVTRELTRGEGVEARLEPENRTIRGERAWDLRLAPLLLALTWRADAAGVAPVVDLFGPRSTERLAASWTGAKAEIAGLPYTVEVGADGRVRALAADATKPVLTVASWKTTSAPESHP